ncbi:MAG: hypothetical protein SOX32_11760 [Candidatus Choladocola sp.]|nr:hypothetical protein [Candidatus Choladocola sp.]
MNQAELLASNDRPDEENIRKLGEIILEMADDLCYGCLMSEYDSYCDPVWESKYVTGKYIRQK